jgi:Rrf2 family protein
MLNQTAIYALRAMGFLARENNGQPILSATIAEEMNIPKNFLSKILNRLSQAGLVHTTRGRNGGMALAKPAGNIKLYEVVDLFMKVNDLKHCFLGLKKCDGSCGLHLRWQIMSEQFEKMLNDTTVDQIF